MALAQVSSLDLSQRRLPDLARRLPDLALRPATWIAVAVLLLAVSPAATSGDSPIALSDVAVAVAGLLAVRTILRGEQLDVARSVPALGLLAIGTAGLIAAVLSHNVPTNVVGAVRYVELFLVAPLAVMVALRTRTDAFILLGALVGLGVGEGALGLVQFATGTGAGIGEDSIRAVGTFGAYNIGSLAQITAVGFVICLAVVVVQDGAFRAWAAAGATVLLLANLASLSRSAWVALAVAALVTVSRGRPARLLGAVTAALALAALILPPLVTSETPIGDRVASLLSSDAAPDQSLVDRQALWAAAVDMSLDNPLTGVGLRAFPDFRDAYADFSLLGSSDISFGSSFDRVALESPHSLYLLVASEQGLVALLVLVTVLAVLLARGLVRAARRRSDLSTTIALAGVGLLSFELVSMITGDLGGPGSILTGICLGLAGWAAADVDLHGP
ncbi:O-antigen ligase [Blastococcus aggregatus]|uniref:O-antigen ligase n=1 Tax=Blastococcus aggregatus TaxID=38502 RepID=A0A285V0U4_9ACTN|nr:O-antigen ligase family protein [Blastococcus aggregatus]SOC47734.1 O-antigen ligase [Blastococcus aggregatus]